MAAAPNSPRHPEERQREKEEELEQERGSPGGSEHREPCSPDGAAGGEGLPSRAPTRCQQRSNRSALHFTWEAFSSAFQ